MPTPGGPEDITRSWLTAVIAEVQAFRGATVEDVHATVIGEGFGLDGTVARLDLDVRGPMPARLVAKFARAGRGRSEIRFYETLAPRMPIRLARYHVGRVDEDRDRAVLLLEHVAPAEQGDVLRGATRPQALAIARAMARFHAAFAGSEDPALAKLPPWAGQADSIAGKVEERRARFLERYGAGLPERARALVVALPAHLDRAEDDLSRAASTLIHGDLHLDNILFPSPDEPVILDWPDARRGPAVMDFVRLLVEGMTVEFRRRCEAEVLDAYAAEREVAGRPIPSPDTWKGQMRAAFVWHLAYAVAWGGAERPGYDTPRVREIVASLIRNTTAAAEDHVGELR